MRFLPTFSLILLTLLASVPGSRADGGGSRVSLEPPDLGFLSGANRIRICDDWIGLGVGRRAHYDLKRVGTDFIGEAIFQAGQRETTAAVTIPSVAAKSFLTLLSGSALVEGKYQPEMTHTDDYPSVGIELDVGKEIVLFYSESQGEEHVPWGVAIRDEFYTIPSNTVARALFLLRSYLKEHLLGELVRVVESRESPSLQGSIQELSPCPGLFTFALEPTGFLRIGHWTLSRANDAKTRQKRCVLQQISVERPSMISIQGLGEKIEVGLMLLELPANNDETRPMSVTYSFDGDDPITESWVAGTESRLAFSPNSAEFISRLKESEKLVASITNDHGRRMNAEFSFVKNEDALEVFDRCRH